MNVIAFKAKDTRPAKAGVTVFMHLRQTTLIAHLAPQRRAVETAATVRKTSRTLT